MYYVSRQHYYYQNIYVVEVAAGGIDSAGCDMLFTENPEMKRLEGEYKDPREAIKNAIALIHLWRKVLRSGDYFRLHNKPSYTVSGLVVGSLLDMCEGETVLFSDAREWAEKEYNSLEKCAYCGDILPDNKKDRYYLPEFQIDDEEYCSESCSDNDYWAIVEANSIEEYEEELYLQSLEEYEEEFPDE